MSCCISTAIGLSWTDEQLHEKSSRLVSAIKKVLAQHTSHAAALELTT